LTRANALLARAGDAFARLWSLLVGIAILLSFPVAGVALSLVIGMEAMWWIGGGAWTFFITAYLFGLFLSIYVWEPSVKALTYKLLGLISGKSPN
jgi:hypothetical protein